MSAGALKIGRQKVQRATAWVKRMKPKIFTVGSAPENPQLRKRGKLNPWLVTSSHRIVWGFVLSDFGKVFGLLGIPVLPIFFAICSILELEAAISTIFSTFWSSDQSFATTFATCWCSNRSCWFRVRLVCLGLV